MNTVALVETLQNANQDFEWYPTTRRMVDVIRKHIASGSFYGNDRISSILDVGAGDGRVLMMLAETFEHAKLYGIEKSFILQQQQPERIVPVGTEFHEQNLMGLPMDIVFSNPPYSEFEDWVCRLITTINAKRLYVVIPQRWENSDAIAGALKTRDAKATIIHRDDFYDADRAARAVVHVLCIQFGSSFRDDSYYRDLRQDPFDLWFDQNIDVFEKDKTLSDYDQEQQALARIHEMDGIPSMVAAYDEEYARMEDNYKAIFRLDQQLLKELGVNKQSLREGLKKRIVGLKNVYWQGLFQRLDVITSRLTTKTKEIFLDRVTGQTAVAFTASNAYAVVLWAIKQANKYIDQQVIDVFQDLSNRECHTNYKSNLKTWDKDGWRYNQSEEKHSHYMLDYRIVLHHYKAIHGSEWGEYDYPGGLHNTCHCVIDDLIAVFGNLGFPVRQTMTKDTNGRQVSRLEQAMHTDVPSRVRVWRANAWQDFRDNTGEIVFQVKAFLNGNMHLRFNQKAIRALNIEAARLLGWVRSAEEAATEMGIPREEAERFFGSNQLLGASTRKMLAGSALEDANAA